MSQQAISFETRDVADRHCPSCRHQGMRQFYHLPAIPVHSCLLMETRDEALAHPRGELRLASCPACGFITNLSYQPQDHHYSDRYEETQGFSPTFSEFTESLVSRLIDRYDLHSKSVLEIGCGKGEFLALLCQKGDNRGIGIDPSFVPGRLPAEMEARIEVFREFYREEHCSLKPDFVCCRHTLEHIPNVREFVQQVRAGIGDRMSTGVFFDLPDVVRVLTEGAFWDLYYEHCSYFSLGSLARLFRSCQFDVTDLALDYGGQWLMLEALPASRETVSAFDAEHDLEALQEAVETFDEHCGRVVQHWTDTIGRLHRQGAQIVVWGSGSKGVAFLTTLGVTDQVACVVDINPHKHGRFMPGTGHPIIGPDSLVEYRPTHVIMMNPVYCDEIGRDLERLSIEAEMLAV
jgi:SAM-dependent methyltransferase